MGFSRQELSEDFIQRLRKAVRWVEQQAPQGHRGDRRRGSEDRPPMAELIWGELLDDCVAGGSARLLVYDHAGPTSEPPGSDPTIITVHSRAGDECDSGRDSQDGQPLACRTDECLVPAGSLVWCFWVWRDARYYVLPLPEIWRLVDCRSVPHVPPRPDVYVKNRLAPHSGKIALWDGTCWRIEPATCPVPDCVDPICAAIVAIYADCSRCQSCWLLTECVLEGEPETFITSTDLAQYEDQVIKIASEPDACWVVSHYGLCPSDPTPVEVIGHYEFCSECVCWDLEQCDDSANIRKVSNDLFRLAIAAGKLDEEDTLDDVISQGIVFEIGGVCYVATAYGECSLSSEELEISAVHDDCTACGCIKLVRCDAPENVIYAHSAVDGDNDPLNLRLLVGQVVRLVDGACYIVSIPDPLDCDEPEQVQVLEAYANCAACKCYTLYLCGSGDDPGTRIDTYTDLEGLGYTIGQTIRVADGESFVCYVIEDDEADCSEAVGVVPLAQYPDCETCAGDRRYRLVNDCANEGCDGTDEDFTPQADRITNEDLSGAVGQRIRAYGYCWYVSIEDPETPVSSGWEAPVTWYGPYPTCVACADNTVYPWSHFFDLVEIDEDGRLVRHRYERIVRGPGVESICDRGTTYLCESCEPPLCSQLQLCHSDPAEYLYTQDDLSPAVVNDVLQRQEDGLWYTLLATGVPCGYPIQAFTVDDTDTECPEPPELCTRLILCGTEEDEPPTYVYTQSDLSAYELLDVLERDEDSEFYIVDAFGVACGETPVAFTVDSNPETCPEPPETCTELTLCGSGGATKLYTQSGGLTLGSFYKIDSGENAGCWEVTDADVACVGEPETFVPDSGPFEDCECAAPDPCIQIISEGDNAIDRTTGGILIDFGLSDPGCGSPNDSGAISYLGNTTLNPYGHGSHAGHWWRYNPGGSPGYDLYLRLDTSFGWTLYSCSGTFGANGMSIIEDSSTHLRLEIMMTQAGLIFGCYGCEETETGNVTITVSFEKCEGSGPPE